MLLLEITSPSHRSRARDRRRRSAIKRRCYIKKSRNTFFMKSHLRFHLGVIRSIRSRLQPLRIRALRTDNRMLAIILGVAVAVIGYPARSGALASWYAMRLIIIPGMAVERLWRSKSGSGIKTALTGLIPRKNRSEIIGDFYAYYHALQLQQTPQLLVYFWLTLKILTLVIAVFRMRLSDFTQSKD